MRVEILAQTLDQVIEHPLAHDLPLEWHQEKDSDQYLTLDPALDLPLSQAPDCDQALDNMGVITALWLSLPRLRWVT